jgi:hypothetical protein
MYESDGGPAASAGPPHFLELFCCITFIFTVEFSLIYCIPLTTHKLVACGPTGTRGPVSI